MGNKVTEMNIESPNCSGGSWYDDIYRDVCRGYAQPHIPSAIRGDRFTISMPLWKVNPINARQSRQNLT
jgi:hypothetical protein